MSSKKVTATDHGKKAAPVNGKVKSQKELFPEREVDLKPCGKSSSSSLS